MPDLRFTIRRPLTLARDPKDRDRDERKNTRRTASIASELGRIRQLVRKGVEKRNEALVSIAPLDLPEKNALSRLAPALEEQDLDAGTFVNALRATELQPGIQLAELSQQHPDVLAPEDALGTSRVLEQMGMEPPSMEPGNPRGGGVAESLAHLFTTAVTPPRGVDVLSQQAGRVPYAGPGLEHSTSFLTSPLGAFAAPFALGPTLAGEGAAVTARTAAELAGAPEGVKTGVEIGAGVVGGMDAALDLPSTVKRIFSARAAREAGEGVTEVGSRAVTSEANPRLAPSGVVDTGVSAGREAAEAPVLPRADDDLVPRGTVDTQAQRPPPRPAGGGSQDILTGALRPLREVEEEVVSSDNPVVRAIVGKTGMNPSILENTPLGKLIVARERQRIAADQLSDLAAQATVDVHAQRYTGRALPMHNISDQGIVKNVGAPEGTSRQWNDVYSRPDRYALSPEQRAPIDDYLRAVEEAEFQRTMAGLKPRATRGPEAAEGWFYVPRQVKGVRGVEIRRPSNASLQRHYEEAAEGVAKGVNYDNPRETLRLHLRQAYQEIIDKQFSDRIEELNAEAMQRGERLFVTPKELVPEPILAEVSQATLARISAERELRQLQGQSRSLEVGGRETGEAGVAARTLRTSRAPARTANTEQIRAAQARVSETLPRYEKAKLQYRRAVETARKREVASGNIFGQAEETIPIAQWRGKFFPREDAERLTEALGFIRPPVDSPFVRGVYSVGNAIRFLSAVGDFAEPFIQGLPVLATRPGVWAQQTARHYQAFFDPTVQARFARDHLEEFQEMAAHGTPIGDPEFFSALEPGQGLSPGVLLKILPKGDEVRRLFQRGGRQTFGRFQASYNTGLAVSRALLTKGLKAAIPDAAERQASIRNLTGGLDSRALGVGPRQRAAEGFYLAFSPRLLRSTVALVGDLRKGVKNPQGRQAFETLGALAAGATGLYVTTGLALGKDWETIEAGLNPLNGKRFLAHEVNGDWIGVGGQIRAITQLMTRIAADPESVASTDTFDNPLLSFYQSRGAPVFNTVGAVGELATGADTAPYAEIDSAPDFFKHIGTSALPFVVQGILEGQQPLTSATAMVGARTSPENSYERFQGAQRQAQSELGIEGDYDSLDDLQQAQVNKHSAVVEAGEGFADRDDTRSRGFDFIEEMRTRQQTEQQQDDASVKDYFLSGGEKGMAPKVWQENEGNREREAFSSREAIKEFAGIAFEDQGSGLRVNRAMDAYFEIDVDDYTDDAGETDWSAFFDARDQALSPLSSSEQRIFEDDVLGKYETPVQRAIRKLQAGLDPYFDIPSEERELREQARLGDPALDAALFVTGVTSTLLSSEAASEAQRQVRRVFGSRARVPADAMRDSGPLNLDRGGQGRGAGGLGLSR